MKDGGPASTRMGTIEAVLFDVDGVLQPMSPGYVDLARACRYRSETAEVTGVARSSLEPGVRR